MTSSTEDHRTDEAEDHVISSLEARKQQMHAMPKDKKAQRIAHLPLLLKKMKSEQNEDDGRGSRGSGNGLEKEGSAKQFPTRPESRMSKMFQEKDQTRKTDTDTFYDHAIHLQSLMEGDDGDFGDDDDTETIASTNDDDDDDDEEIADSATESSRLLKKKRKKKRQKLRSKFRGLWRRLVIIFRPEEIQEGIQDFLRKDVSLFMIPLLALAFVLYYILGNPELVFLPNSATLAWYLLFAVRLQVTYALARISRFVLEIVAIRTSLLARWSGPLVALFAMQSNGWPFMLFAWGLWNIVILHGNSAFIKHWLWFTGLAIFNSEHNPDGDGVLESDIWGRMLSGMVCVGAISALKRTSVALYLSRRMLRNYRPQLESAMSQVQLITGIAGLAAETERHGFEEMIQEANPDGATQVQMQRRSQFMEEVPTFLHSSDNTQMQKDLTKLDEGAQNKNMDLGSTTAPERQDTGKSTLHFDNVVSSLEQWEPPSEPHEQEYASLQEILQFKKAMAWMNDVYPFSTAFGLADTRQSCAKSAIDVYKKLLKFTPQESEDNMLSYEVIGALAFDENGNRDAHRAQNLVRLFMPDQDNKVSVNSFVQSCDSVYKRMLFLRASILNASKIDSVLEDSFNVIFYGILGVVTLTMVGYNPWPLLVSFSTLMVSFTFAVGPSAAKIIEGILAIAVRRPFDLGDRIILCKPEGESKLSESYIVEDINLTTTTLRFAQTNEVSTVNNTSLTSARIVNCARSPKACIRIHARFNSDATLEQLDTLKSRLEKWLSQDPRSWAGLVQFVNETIDRNNGIVVYKIGALHVKSWQDLSLVVKSKGALEREVDSIAFDLGIQYDTCYSKHKVFLQGDKKND